MGKEEMEGMSGELRLSMELKAACYSRQASAV